MVSTLRGFASVRDTPVSLALLPTSEQWQHIALTPRFLRLWFSFSLACDIILTTVVYVLGWNAAGQPLLISLPVIVHVGILAIVVVAVHINGPFPHAKWLCPSILLHVYIVVLPLAQESQHVRRVPSACPCVHMLDALIHTRWQSLRCDKETVHVM